MNLTRKVCPPDKVLNPLSNRCVSKTSKLGKSILQQQEQPIQQSIHQQPIQQQPIQQPMHQQPMHQQPIHQQPIHQQPVKACPPDKVLNPLSNRCVSKTSKLGKSVLQQQQMPSPIQQPIHQQPIQEQMPSPIQQQQQMPSSSLLTRKAKVIARFMNRTKHARKANFLNAICSKSGACIAFGVQSNEIKNFFNGFYMFDYVKNFTKTGVFSKNGFVYSVNYEHRGYKANAILKSSASPAADNLMYEHAVGKQINDSFYNLFPIFVETYTYYYKYPNEATWRDFNSNTANAYNLKNTLVPYEGVDYKTACEESKHICILIQHIDRAPTLGKLCESLRFVQTEMVNSLYQIYFTLSIIKNRFTHYDLHADNVLVYSPDPNKFIEYHFHTLMGEVITFKSRYLIKIIDYGRSYVEHVSELTRTTVCAENACRPSCGASVGFWMKPPLPHFIKSWKHNVSHDLKLLENITEYLQPMAHRKPPQSIESLIYTAFKNKIIFTGEFGTEEIESTRQPANVANVSDAEVVLRRLIKSDAFKRANVGYSSAYTKMGDLTIYSDGSNMTYVASV